MTCSHEVSPEFREYERTVTTVVNAYLRPACRAYLRGLADAADTVRGDDLGGRAGRRRSGAAELPGRPAALGSGGRRARRPPRWPRPAASPTRSPSTWAAPAPTSASSADGAPEPAAERAVAGLPRPAAVARRPHHRRRRRLDRPRSIRAARWSSGPRSAGAVPGPGLLRPRRHRAHGHRRRPRARADPGRRRAPRRSGRARLDAAPPGRADARGRRRRTGVIAVVDAAMEQAVRAVSVERGVDPPGLALVAFGGAGPLHACALADALGMAAVIVPPRAGVLSAVGAALRAPAARELCGVAHAGRPRRPRRRPGRPGRRPPWPGRSGRPTTSSVVALDCRYAGPEPRAAGRRRSPTSPPSTSGATATPGPRPRSRSSPSGPRPAGRRRRPWPTCRVVGAGGGRRPRRRSPRPTARLGAGRLAGRPRSARVRWCSTRVRRVSGGGELDPAGLAVLIARLTGVAEEMGAVLRRARVQPQHQGAGRLLGRPVHRRRQLLVQAEHIPVHLGSMPASVAAAIAAGRRRSPEPGEQSIVNDPFAGGTHLNDVTLVAPCHASTAGSSGGPPTGRTTPTSAGPRPDRSRPTPPRSSRRGSGCRRCASRRRCATCSWRRPGRRTSAAATSTPRWGRTSSAWPGWPTLGRRAARRGDRLRRAAHAGRAGRVARRRSGRPPTCSTRPVPGRTSSAPPRSAVTVTVAGDADHLRLHRHRPPAGGQRQRRRGRHRQRRRVRPALGHRPRRCPANGGALRPVTVVAPSGTLVAARPPAAVGAGNVEVSQRVADVCLARPGPGRARPGGRGVAGDDEQRPHRRRRLGVLRDRRRRAGRAAPTGAATRPGMSGVHTGMTNTRNTPIEALRAGRSRCGSAATVCGGGAAAPGARPGGDGIERDLEVLEDVTVSLITERRVSRPWGLAGGGPGAVGRELAAPRRRRGTGRTPPRQVHAPACKPATSCACSRPAAAAGVEPRGS